MMSQSAVGLTGASSPPPASGLVKQLERLRSGTDRAATLSRKNNHLPQPWQGVSPTTSFPARRDLINHREVVDTAKPIHRDQNRGVRLLEQIAQLIPTIEDVERDGHCTDTRDRVLQRYKLGVISND